MVLVQAKKPLKIKTKSFVYDFRENLIQDIPEEHAQILLNTEKIKLYKQ